MSHQEADRTETSAQLRNAIDSGRTRDRIAMLDPAAAPLGTDDEAAGTPPKRHSIQEAAHHEMGRRLPEAAEVKSGWIGPLAVLLIVAAIGLAVWLGMW